MPKHYYSAYLTEEDRKIIIKDLFEVVLDAMKRVKKYC